MSEQTFIEIVQHQARVKPQALAYRCGDRRWTYADIERLCAVEFEGVEGVICGRSIYTGALDFEAGQRRADELST